MNPAGSLRVVLKFRDLVNADAKVGTIFQRGACSNAPESLNSRQGVNYPKSLSSLPSWVARAAFRSKPGHPTLPDGS
jgi:hypothetical protein